MRLDPLRAIHESHREEAHKSMLKFTGLTPHQTGRQRMPLWYMTDTTAEPSQPYRGRGQHDRRSAAFPRLHQIVCRTLVPVQGLPQGQGPHAALAAPVIQPRGLVYQAAAPAPTPLPLFHKHHDANYPNVPAGMPCLPRHRSTAPAPWLTYPHLESIAVYYHNTAAGHDTWESRTTVCAARHGHAS